MFLMARNAQKPISSKSKAVLGPKPYCFVSYSTREAHVQIMVDCLRIVLGNHFEVRLTPSALESGASQHDQILSLIEDSAFAIVILDGLRPNVIYELGLIQGRKKPVLLFKEAESVVDIKGLYSNPPAELGVNYPPINLDTQMSDIKDLFCAKWLRFDLKNTVNSVWLEYNKKRDAIPGFVEIEEPLLCK
jgi:hypothetical protein